MLYEVTEANIVNAAKLIKAGGLVAFPTETVYGLGANAFNAEAVQAIFTLKQRPNFNPLIVHLTEVEQLEKVAEYKGSARLVNLVTKLQKFWPGPLSLILPKKKEIPYVVTGGLETVAVRLPAHPVARALIEAAGCPIAAPSANRFMHISPTLAQHVETSLGKKLFILDGGATNVGLESTVLTLVTDPPQLLRPGFVTLEDLRATIGEVELGAHTSVHPASPGMIRRHYAPRTKLLFKKDVTVVPENSALIAFNHRLEPIKNNSEKKFEARGENVSKNACADFSNFREVIYLSENGDLTVVAAKLFKVLYELDAKGFELIVIDDCAKEGLGLAIMDRLSRATEAD